MSFLLLPLLPNRRIDPWDSVNPYQIWLLAILVAGVSFVGYIAVRAFGDRLGVLMTAVAGGLASSTAPTLAFARLGGASGVTGAAQRGHPDRRRGDDGPVGVVAVALNGALLASLACR